jgi:hypothetical protein
MPAHTSEEGEKMTSFIERGFKYRRNLSYEGESERDARTRKRERRPGK